MRTTFTIDHGVAASLERLRKTRGGKLEDLVNEALRRGIKDMTAHPQARKAFRTRVVDLGEVLIPLDKVSEALVVAEGQTFK
jgi:hypothetical protein